MSKKPLIVLLTIFYIFLTYKYFTVPRYWSPVDFLNLGIHEVGHILFHPFGEFIAIAGGTIAQLAAPLISIFVFKKQRDKVGMIFCLAWLGTNWFSVATYAGDAQTMTLPLVSLPGATEIIHDWNYLLLNTGLIEKTKQVEQFFRILGYLSLIIAMGLNVRQLFNRVKE